MKLKDMSPEAREAWRAETARRYPSMVALMKLAAGTGFNYCVRDDRGAVGDEGLEAKRNAEWEAALPWSEAPQPMVFKRRNLGVKTFAVANKKPPAEPGA